MAMGTFMLFRRDAYTKVGGHTSVRGELLEDVHLGWTARKHGLACGFVNLADLVTCDMHESGDEALEGLTRWFRNLALISAPGLALACGAAALWMFSPWLRLCNAAALRFRNHSFAKTAIAFLPPFIATVVAQRPLRTLGAYPASTWTWVRAATRGIRCSLTRGPNAWRGREYAAAMPSTTNTTSNVSDSQPLRQMYSDPFESIAIEEMLVGNAAK